MAKNRRPRPSVSFELTEHLPKSKSSREGLSLCLIDGNSMVYRAYYAIPSLSNSQGEPTNAVYGFVTMVRKLIEEKHPDSLAVCFDHKEPTFRHKKFEEYKAHRKPMPDDLVEQLEPIKRFCTLYNVATFEKAGYEADDLLGTLAKKAEKSGFSVFIVTGDKDAMQLVSDKVKILNPHKEDQVLGPDEVKERFDGLGPECVVDLMALMGDSSDNIPGVLGIGEKTAIKLIQQFGSFDNLFGRLGQVASKSQRALLEEHTDMATLSRDLARIDVEAPIDVSWEELKMRPPQKEKLAEFFKRYEFRSLLKEFSPTGEGLSEERQYEIVQNAKEFKMFVSELKKTSSFSFDTETTGSDPMRAELVGMSFSWEPFHAYYVPVSSGQHGGPGLPKADVLDALRPVLENAGIRKIGQNIKYDWIVMKRNGIRLCGIYFDTMIASYLINPLKLNHNLDDIALEYLGLKKISLRSLLGEGKKRITMAEVPLEKVMEYAGEDADCVFRLMPLLMKRLNELGLSGLFRDLEMPLSEVLAKMEMNGVSLDVKFLEELSEKAAKDLERLTREIYEEAGEEFNINSPKQLGEVLFARKRLPVIKRTKTGYSTDVGVLEKLAKNHLLPRKMLEYRERTKLKSTYLDALPEMLNPETRLIHTSYHQTTTATGRLSSSEPNLQNIPVKTEAGRLIRKAFVTRRGGGGRRVILSADYSQIELRVLAHLSGDQKLKKAFEEDRDVHKYTATLLYGTREEDVTRQMRDVAKTINFSIIYGKTAYGLSQDLGIPIAEAEGFISGYFDRYRQVRDYLEGQKEKARTDGYLTTLLGRRSYFPDIRSKNMQVRQFAERAAINAPIQGSAADIIKLSMIAIQKRIEDEKLRSLMTMQVHDELVFDMLEEEKGALVDIVKKEMEGAYPLAVPLRVDLFIGDSWYKN